MTSPKFPSKSTPKKRTAETQVKYTIHLLAKDKDDSSKVQVLPDAELTVHVGADGKLRSVEAEINLIKKKIERDVKLAGKTREIEIEATVSLSSEGTLGGTALKSVETKIKAELEVKLGQVSVKPNIELDPSTGKIEPGLAIVIWRWGGDEHKKKKK